MEIICLFIIAFDELLAFQAQIEALEGLTCDDQIISHCGIPLQDETLICQSGIEEFNTLEVSSRLLGGKDQTPVALLPSTCDHLPCQCCNVEDGRSENRLKQL